MATFVPGFVIAGVARLAEALARRLRQGAAGRDPKAQHARTPRRDTARAPRATLAEVADHIVYLVETAGLDHVGIGSDFFGGAQPVGLENVGCFPDCSPSCSRRGFSERDLEKISSRATSLRVMRKVEEVGERLRLAREPAVGRLEDYPGA